MHSCYIPKLTGEVELALLRHGVQQQHRLAPCSIDLVPFHRVLGSAAQPEATDSPKRAVMPDSERIIQHIGGLHKQQQEGAVSEV